MNSYLIVSLTVTLSAHVHGLVHVDLVAAPRPQIWLNLVEGAALSNNLEHHLQAVLDRVLRIYKRLLRFALLGKQLVVALEGVSRIAYHVYNQSFQSTCDLNRNVLILALQVPSQVHNLPIQIGSLQLSLPQLHLQLFEFGFRATEPCHFLYVRSLLLLLLL